MCAGMIISLYKYVKLCTGGQGGGKTMGNVRGWDVTEWGFFMRILKFFIYFLLFREYLNTFCIYI